MQSGVANQMTKQIGFDIYNGYDRWKPESIYLYYLFCDKIHDIGQAHCPDDFVAIGISPGG
jgi:hypothetical protein